MSKPRMDSKHGAGRSRDDHDGDEIDDYDEADAELEDDDDEDEPARKSTALRKKHRPTSAKTGFWKGYFEQSRAVLLSPRDFFETMPDSGGLQQPAIFLLVSSSIYSLLQAISSLKPFVFFTAMFSSICGAFIAAAVISFACGKLGGKGTFEGTFRVIAYSKATLLFAWLSLGPIPIGGIVSILYGCYLNIIGIEDVHQMPRKIVATLIIVVAIIGLALKFKLG